MAPSTYNVAVALNNKGAYLFAKGDVTAASTHFRAALVKTFVKQSSECAKQKVKLASRSPSAPLQMKTLVDSRPLAVSTTTASAATPESSVEQRPLGGAGQHPASLVPQITPATGMIHQEREVIRQSSTSRDQSAIANLPSIFLCIKTVVLSLEGRAAGTPVNVVQVTSAVTFNLALCYHVFSSSQPTKATVYRQKAIHLYKIAHRLRLRAARIRRRGQNWQPNVLDLSVLNNLGLLFFQTGQHDHSRRCFEQLSSSLSQFDLARIDSSGFVRNLTILFPERILAPAA